MVLLIYYIRKSIHFLNLSEIFECPRRWAKHTRTHKIVNYDNVYNSITLHIVLSTSFSSSLRETFLYIYNMYDYVYYF